MLLVLHMRKFVPRAAFFLSISTEKVTSLRFFSLSKQGDFAIENASQGWVYIIYSITVW